MKAVAEPSEGAVIGQAFHYAGLVTQKQHAIAKVGGDRVWTEDGNQEFKHNAARA
jgi:hypothetical protein